MRMGMSGKTDFERGKQRFSELWWNWWPHLDGRDFCIAWLDQYQFHKRSDSNIRVRRTSDYPADINNSKSKLIIGNHLDILWENVEVAWIAEPPSIPGKVFDTVLNPYQAPSHLLHGLAEIILEMHILAGWQSMFKNLRSVILWLMRKLFSWQFCRISLLVLVQFHYFLGDRDGNIKRVHIKWTGDTMLQAIGKTGTAWKTMK